jgi:hypothetical protein
MTIDAWLSAAVQDAERRQLPELKPLLESLAQSTRALRRADEAERQTTEPARRTDGRTS